MGFVRMETRTTRETWLLARRIVGGSDAATIIGMNPWKNNVELWMEKTGQREAEDISEKPLVKYGTRAEHHLRQLFKLDYPEFKVDYKKNNIWTNDDYPWAHASLDGWLTDKDGRKGILEIKTTNVMSSRHKEEWKDRIPDNYYCQLLHYLAVTQFDFAILKAQLKWDIEGSVYCQTKHYQIERADVESDIKYLMDAEKKFAEDVENRHKPALILPEI